jgi:hypothetical protein
MTNCTYPKRQATNGCVGVCSKEIYLSHRELKEILSIVEEHNPPDTMCLQAGSVKISVDSSSGIGSLVKATIPIKVGDRYGEWTVTITDESDW